MAGTRSSASSDAVAQSQRAARPACAVRGRSATYANGATAAPRSLLWRLWARGAREYRKVRRLRACPATGDRGTTVQRMRGEGGRSRLLWSVCDLLLQRDQRWPMARVRGERMKGEFTMANLEKEV